MIFIAIANNEGIVILQLGHGDNKFGFATGL